MATPSIEALYRKIAGIENPLLCWSLASTKWNDNGICIPKELCSKIRCFLPPSTLDTLPLHPKGGYVVNENTRFCQVGHSVIVDSKIGEVEHSMMFGNEYVVDSSMRLASYRWKVGDLAGTVVKPDLNPVNLFHSWVGDIEFTSREIASKAEHRDVVIGGYTFHAPISKLNFDLPETRACVVDLKKAFGGRNMQVGITADPDLSDIEILITGNAGVMRMTIYSYSFRSGRVYDQDYRGNFCDVDACEKAVLALAAPFF